MTTNHPPEDEALPNNCPICLATDAEEREMGSFVRHYCQSCTISWVLLTGEGDPNHPTEQFEDGLYFGENLQDVALYFESEGLQTRGIIGTVAWDALKRTTNSQVARVQVHKDGSRTRTQEAERHQFAGVKLTIQPSLGNALIVLGENGLRTMSIPKELPTDKPAAIEHKRWRHKRGDYEVTVLEVHHRTTPEGTYLSMVVVQGSRTSPTKRVVWPVSVFQQSFKPIGRKLKVLTRWELLKKA